MTELLRKISARRRVFYAVLILNLALILALLGFVIR